VVVITEAGERRSGILDGARPTSEDDTATTFELFFDLVYVFAMTQVTGYMVHAHDALGGTPGPACPRAAVVDLVRVRLAWQPGPGRHRRRACRYGRCDGGAVRRGPHDPGSLG
jgi:Bacterial low temperature requirement A protein (LtrA)